MSTIKIDINDEQDVVDVDYDQIEKTINHVLTHMNISSGQVNLAIVDDETIRQIKNEYFDMDQVTDVISFDLRDDQSDPLECDIVVNAQLADRIAQQRGGSPLAELNLYVVHGLLHQLGFDDQTDHEYELMHKKEDQLLDELGFGCVFKGTGQ